jgi:hypothetical protein
MIEMARHSLEFACHVFMYRWRYIEVMSADLQVHGVAPFKNMAAWATVGIPFAHLHGRGRG